MYIITAVRPTQGVRVDIGGNQDHPRQFVSPFVNLDAAQDYAAEAKTITTFVVANGADLPNMIDRMTRNHAGKDISVFKLQSVSVRAPGELVTKDVSKDGVLPR